MSWKLRSDPECVLRTLGRDATIMRVLHPSRLASSAATVSSSASAIYVHLPFCRRRCFYCDFPIQVVGDRPGAAADAATRYCALLDRELAQTPATSVPLRSVYFGGGTPSLTPPRLLGGLLRSLDRRHGLAADCEVTLEMDPGTFDAAALDAFVAAGVTRVSLGVQSFDDELLEACGRVHRVADADGALQLLLGHTQPLSVSVDLIGGLPHQTLESWQYSLDTAASCGAHHVSVYDLQVEPRTAFGKWFSAGEEPCVAPISSPHLPCSPSISPTRSSTRSLTRSLLPSQATQRGDRRQHVPRGLALALGRRL